MPSDTTILFSHPSLRVRRLELRKYFKDLGGQIAPGRSVTCLLTTDRQLKNLNRQFRGKDYPTDVLSFPSSEPDVSLGELAISYDRAITQAGKLGHGVEDELRILMLHGMLHLSGMDHETDSGEMARAEIRWRKKLGLPHSLIERSRA